MKSFINPAFYILTYGNYQYSSKHMRVYSIGFSHTMINCKTVYSLAKLNIKQYNLLTRVYYYMLTQNF